MSELVIRTATEDDFESILPLIVEFVASFELDSGVCRASFQRLTVNDSALILVAELRGSPVGYCLGFVHDTFYANGPVAWLEEIMVHADHRRSGVARKLMVAFEEWARENGAVLSALATRRAAEFYEAIGYESSATYYRKLL